MAVKIYMTTTCPYCRMAKDFFRKKGIKYEEYNVGTNPKASKEMVEKSGQMGVPVIEIGNTIIIGFDKQAIEKALKVEV